MYVKRPRFAPLVREASPLCLPPGTRSVLALPSARYAKRPRFAQFFPVLGLKVCKARRFSYTSSVVACSYANTLLLLAGIVANIGLEFCQVSFASDNVIETFAMPNLTI